MEYNRYGKFRARDYFGAWIMVSGLLLLSILGLVSTSFWFLAFMIICSMEIVWSIYAPSRERFLIMGNTIIVKKGKKKQEIVIPSEPTLIVSYADVCPPLEKRMGSYRTYILKDRYAVSILQKMELKDVLVRLHEKYATKYFNETIETSFYSWHFCYSFVCDQELLDKLLQNRQCLLIIPESLKEKVVYSSEIENVYIDKGY